MQTCDPVPVSPDEVRGFFEVLLKFREGRGFHDAPMWLPNGNFEGSHLAALDLGAQDVGILTMDVDI